MSANQIVRYARNNGLSVTYDSPTEGDGNCFYRAIVQQLKRDEIREQISPSLQFDDHHILRLTVVNFVKESQNNAQYLYDKLPCVIRKFVTY